MITSPRARQMPLIRPRVYPALVALMLALLTAGCGGAPPIGDSGSPQRPQPSPQVGSAATPGPAPTIAASPQPTVGGTPVAAASPDSATAPTASPGGALSQLEAVLARGATDAYEPQDPTTEFREDVERIYLVLKSAPDRSASVKASWIAVRVPGYDADKEISEGRLSVAAGARGAIWLGAPSGGFAPGAYRVDLSVDGAPARALPFNVTPLLPQATPVEPGGSPRGYNIALAALGGKVEHATSQYDDGRWAADNLVDGAPFIRDGRSCRTTCGWSSKDRTVPQEIVLSFYQGREAAIGAIIVDSTTYETLTRSDRMVKHVEVWASTTSSTDGFAKIGGARLHAQVGDQLIAIPPTRARFVKLIILSNYGGSYSQIGEAKVIEAVDGPSILADAPKNLALPALGGNVVRYTSRYQHSVMATLVDAKDGGGWRSEDGPYGPGSYLPQEIVFAFRDDQVALIDRVVVNPKSAWDPSTWARLIAVSVSTDNPLDGFQEVGQFTLTPEPRDHVMPVGKRARFLKIRILKNGGGTTTSLGTVKILEGTAAGYQSILLAPDAGTVTAATGPGGPVDETGIALEREANNTPAEANPLELGRRTKGTIDPLGEHDLFALSIPGQNPSVLTLEVLGRPNIRTSVDLLDPRGQTLKRFDPGRLPSQQAAFSWLVNPGDHLVRVTEPPVSMVMIWDTSGSMGKRDVQNLQQSMEAFLDQVRPSERLNLIRFSNKPNAAAVEVLLPEFTSDRERLKTATKDKFFAEGGTPLYDAVAKGVALLDGTQGNRAIVVMTDGADTTSELGYPAFWRLLDEKRIRLYTVGLGLELKTYDPMIGTSGSGVLGHTATATNGRFFFARTADDLKGIYEQIAEELRTKSTYYLRAAISRGPGGLAVAATGERLASVSAPSQIELILDASGSMKRRLNGRPMIDIAKDVMGQIIRGLPDNARVALRVYGHRIREGRPGDCRDSELMFPFGKINKAQMLAKVRGINALGTTPIAYTLQQVGRDFGSVPGEKLVIFVTDGKEECKGDPAAAVSALLARGLKVRMNVVGFALADAGTKRDMERIAALTGGKFFDAKDAPALAQAIQQALAVPYDVVDAAGARVASGVTGQGRTELPEGVYSVVVRAAGKPIEIPDVRVAPGGFTKVVLRKEGQEVGIQVQGP